MSSKPLASSVVFSPPFTPAQRKQYVVLGVFTPVACTLLTLILAWLALAEPFPFAVSWVRVMLGACALIFAMAAVEGVFIGARAVRGSRLVAEQALRNDRILRNQGSALALTFYLGMSSALFTFSGGRPWFSDDASWAGTLVWYFLISLPWILPAVTLHGLGLAAILSLLGVEWSALRIGPVEVLRAEGTTRMRWNPEAAPSSVLGLVQFEPHTLVEAPKRMARVLLAVPLVNFLGAGAWAAAAYALGGTGPGEAHGLAALLWIGAVLHVEVGLVEMLPFRLASGQLSHGMRWFMLRRIRGLSRSGRLAAELQLEGFSRRPRDWRPSVETVLSAASEPGERAEISASLHLNALQMLMDRNDFSAARVLLARMAPTLETLPAPFAFEMRLQNAMLHALGDAPDAARARVLLGEVGPYAAETLYPRLAQAAVLLSEGQHAEALAALQQWEEKSLSGGSASTWRAGNQWALERLRAAL